MNYIKKRLDITKFQDPDINVDIYAQQYAEADEIQGEVFINDVCFSSPKEIDDFIKRLRKFKKIWRKD
jgi:hypothetical protein